MKWKEVNDFKYEFNDWKPEVVGDTLIGVVVHQATIQGDLRLWVETIDKVAYSTPSHSNLVVKLSHVKVGDRVKIKYIGIKDVKKENPLMLYKVFVGEPDNE